MLGMLGGFGGCSSSVSGRCLVCIAGMVLVGGCGAGADSRAGPSDDPSSTGSSEVAAGQIDTRSGGSIHYACTGDGTPTILMESGGPAGTEEFSALMPLLSGRSRVCTYDRPGGGLSADVPDHRRTLDDVCRVQDEVIKGLGIREPYVLLGQSFGGNIVIGCADRHPDRLAGLVLIDTYHDDPADMRKDAEEEGSTWKGGPEHVDGVDASEELDTLDMPIGSFALLVLSATHADPGGVENQRYWLGLSSDSRQVAVEGGHNLHFENPEQVASETRAMLNAL